MWYQGYVLFKQTVSVFSKPKILTENETQFTYTKYNQHFNKYNSFKRMPIYPQVCGYTGVSGNPNGLRTPNDRSQNKTNDLINCGKVLWTQFVLLRKCDYFWTK